MSRARSLLASYGRGRTTITGFVLVLLVGSLVAGLPFDQLGAQSLWRIGMNLVLVLSLLPMIRGGAGLNFGLPIGAVAGLLGIAIVLNAGVTGWPGFTRAVLLSVAFAVPIGILYGLTLNAVRGNEMMVGIYLGWSIVSIFCFVWAVAPFDNPKLVWAIGGSGLRNTLQMKDTFGEVLDGAFRGAEAAVLGGFRLRLGLFLAAALLALLVAGFFRTRIGLAIRAAGENPRFAEAAGVKVGRTRVVAVTLSTVLAAIGMVIYSQSYGFAQLYFAPFWIAFPAVAAILIGGATVRRATIFHVVIGVTLFQTILTVAPPVLSAAVPGIDITETLRTTIQNGVILYALTRVGGAR